MPTPCSEPAQDNVQPLSTQVTYKSRLSQAFRDALYALIGTVVAAAAIGLSYFLGLRNRYYLEMAFRSDLIVGLALGLLVSFVAAITCTVMIREVLATKGTARLDNMAPQTPPASNTEVATDGASAFQQHGAAFTEKDSSADMAPASQPQAAVQHDISTPQTSPKALDTGNDHDAPQRADAGKAPESTRQALNQHASGATAVDSLTPVSDDAHTPRQQGASAAQSVDAAGAPESTTPSADQHNIGVLQTSPKEPDGGIVSAPTAYRPEAAAQHAPSSKVGLLDHSTVTPTQTSAVKLVS